MPKEITHDESGIFDVVVGWHPGAMMQLGVQASENRALVSQLYGDQENLVTIGKRLVEFASDWSVPTLQSSEAYNDWYAKQGRDLLDLVEGSSRGINGESSTGGYDSVWTILDREGCNRVIRSLRKARDAAFGRDE